eukprot:150103_1
MRNTLHLDTYTPFQRTQLQIQHMDIIWRYLDRLYILQKGNWKQIPDCVMNLYQIQIATDEIKTELAQFIAMLDLDELWKFLKVFRRFLEKVCKTVEKDAHIRPLVIYLENVADIQYELIQYFPNKIMLNQAAQAYKYCAEKYQERCDRENVKEALEKQQ